MPKQTMSFTETLLKQSGAMKDYEKSKKLYERFIKEKSKGRDTSKQIPVIISTMKSAIESIERIKRVYKSQMEAIAKELNTEDYSLQIEENKAYWKTLQEYYINIISMYNDVSPVPYKTNSTEPEKLEKPVLKDNTEKHTDKNLTIEEILNAGEIEVEEARARTRKRLIEAGYNTNDIKKYLEEQSV